MVARANDDSPLAGFVLRWWGLLFIGGLVGLGGGFAYGRMAPTSFQSTALMQVRPDPSSQRPATDAGVEAVGFAAAAVAPSILDHVSQALRQAGINVATTDLITWSQSNKLTVQPIKGSSAITVSATHDDPTIAQTIADTVTQVVVDDAAAQASADATARKTELQKNMDQARSELASAQLYQREQDLQQRLQTEQTLLLQLQSSYQQALQQQVQVALLLRPPQNAPQVPVPTADEQRQLRALSATATEALKAELDSLRTQQDAAQQTLAELDGQLASTRDQLSRIPDPTAGTTARQPDGSDADPGGTQASAAANLDVAGQIASLQQQQQQLRDQQGQDQLLEKRENDLTKQHDDLQTQSRALQSQIQQVTTTQQTQTEQLQQQQQQLQQDLARELNNQGLLKAQIDTFVPPKGATQLTDEQQVRLQGVLTAVTNSKMRVQQLNDQLQVLSQRGPSSAATDSTVHLLQKQLQDVQQTGTDVDAQLRDVQSRRATLQVALGPNPAGAIQSFADQIVRLQQQQHDQDAADRFLQGQYAALKQQEQDLVRQRENARTLLVQLQREQQQDIQRQTDLDQRNVQAQVAQNAPAPTPNANVPDQLMDDAAGLRNDLLGQISQQQQQVTTTIADLASQLDAVHQALAALPVKLDGAQAAAQATAAAQRLGTLSQELTRLLVNQASGGGPLERFGPAAPAIPLSGGFRMLPVGAAAGLGLAAVLAYLLQLLQAARAPRHAAALSNGAGALPSVQTASFARNAASRGRGLDR